MPLPAPIPDDLIAALRCPETRQPLSLADDATLERLRSFAGDPGLEGALIRGDRRRAYPIRDGFPILLIDEAIEIPTDTTAA